MSRKKYGRRHKVPDIWKGLGWGVLGVSLLGALCVGYFWAKSNKVEIDKASLCPKAGPKSIHVFLFDQSDVIDQQQAQRVRQIIDVTKRKAVFGQRIDLYAFGPDARTSLVPLLSICSPGKAESANALIESPEIIQRDYDQRFARAIDRTLEELLRESKKNRSPIVESLRGAALSSFGAASPNTPLKLTIISDMIQHSDAFSQIRSDPTFAAIAKLPSWPSISPRLHGVELEILYLLRPTAKRGQMPIQSRGHQTFWEQLLSACGATVKQIEPI